MKILNDLLLFPIQHLLDVFKIFLHLSEYFGDLPAKVFLPLLRLFELEFYFLDLGLDVELLQIYQEKG